MFQAVVTFDAFDVGEGQDRVIVLELKERDRKYVTRMNGFLETEVIRGENLLFRFETYPGDASTGFHALITSIEGKNTSA